MKTENEFMEVFTSSKTQNNPYKVGDKKHWQGYYCETVIKTQKKLHVPNALKDTNWDKNPDLKLGMIAYLGYPINLPNQKPFGTLCVLDKKERQFSAESEKLLLQFKKVIELDLALILSLGLKENSSENEVIQKLLRSNEEYQTINEELEQRENERTAQLKASNEELEAFSYSVSHDLRAPLRHINGYIGLLEKNFRADLPEKAQYYMTTITDAVQKMGTLIDDLLQFSRTGRQEVHKSKIEMNALVEEVLETIKQDTEKREITWKIQQLPQVFGDDSMLKRVWLNLLDNAVKYTRNTKKAEISISFKEEENNIVFFVRDNGVGFDMKYADNLFGVFQRLHSEAEFEGTGIGLANVQRIIHKHKGRVWAEAEPGKGATFFFSLPKVENK
ncbi:MAG: ATP-binding protein [Bacteroidales bacterium]|nr:ATP-binding protein [Bacteroidales bacterium]